MEKSALQNILFLDIETVSLSADFSTLPERLKPHWKKKAERISPDETIPAAYFNRAAIYAEFGKVLCIGIGAFYHEGTHLKVKTLYQASEKELLEEFANILQKHSAGKNLLLCAHNGKEFDFPFLCRRMLINGIDIPDVIQISGKKPWEIRHLDTLEMWKFGDYKSFTSLDLLASVFDIPGSKNEMDGSEVNSYYYHKNGLQKIIDYCKEDVVVLAQLYLKMNGADILPEDHIHRI